MILQPIDYVVYTWLVLALLSAIYVAVDQFWHNPEAAVMKWGFVLVTLYMGPIGLLLYVLSDKEPAPGTHEAFVAPLWKQAVGSTVHCVAGDATGIILAAIATAVLGLPMWADLIVEYVAGFLFGLLIFQALFMRAVMGGSYGDNVRRSFLPELLSMNLMMAGMAPVMTTMMMGRDMRAMEPTELVFDLLPTAKRFQTGHRIRVTVQGADRNTHMAVHLKPPAKVAIYHDAGHPSRVVLPVVPIK